MRPALAEVASGGRASPPPQIWGLRNTRLRRDSKYGCIAAGLPPSDKFTQAIAGTTRFPGVHFAFTGASVSFRVPPLQRFRPRIHDRPRPYRSADLCGRWCLRWGVGFSAEWRQSGRFTARCWNGQQSA